MRESPFAKRAASSGAGSDRRRSTRVEFQTPIILSGRDASGQTFREETQTSIVNYHGGRIKTSNRLLIGMLVRVENPRNGLAESAVCVRVEEAGPGETGNYIAVQLVKPVNIWGLKNPPQDWGMEDKSGEISYGSRAASHDMGQPRDEFHAAPAAESSLALHKEQSEKIVEEALARLEAGVKAMEAASEARLAQSLEKAVAEADSSLEERLGRIMSSTLKTLEEQSGQIVKGTLDRLQTDLKDPLAASENQLTQDVEKVVAEAESSLIARSAQVMESAQEVLREQSEQVVDEALARLATGMTNLESASESLLTQRVDKILSDVESSIAALRRDVSAHPGEEDAALGHSAEQFLQPKLPELVSPLEEASPVAHPLKTPQTAKS